MATIRQHRYEETADKQGQVVGIIAVLVFHLLVFGGLYLNGFSITYPLPGEKGIEITFEDVEDGRVAGMPRNKLQRVVENPTIINDPGNSAPESAKIAESNQSTRPMPQPDAKPSSLSENGDVEVPVEKPKDLNNRALFQSSSQGTEDASNSNNIKDKSLYQGVGISDQVTRTANTPIGPEHRQMVTANLDGRSVVGSLPLPSYNSQNQGRVVVRITVDQNGKVTKANAVGVGSTVQDAELWKAAEKAALRASFNVKKDAPIFQTGTITYIFRLN